MTFRKMIPAYLENRLPDGRLNEFQHHLENCPQCREELEIHFIVTNGVEILDHSNGDYNLSKRFKNKLSETRAYLKGRKSSLRFGFVIDTLVFWAVIASAILYWNLYSPW